MTPRARAVWASVAVVLLPAIMRAQAPAGADRLSPHAVAESLAVLRTLHDQIVHNYKDPVAWYHQGMVAWALNERCRHTPPVTGLDCTRTRMLADTALMIAGELDTANTHYRAAFNQFLLSSDGTFRREAPYLDRLLRSSLDRMRRAKDPIAHADGALDAGRLYWLRYDATAERMTMNGKRPTTGFEGDNDYARAEALFREAFDAAPAYLRAYRSYAMLLANRNRWSELRDLAAGRLATTPRDGWSWMTLGLSHYRLGDKPLAVAAFDSAQRTLSTEDAHRMVRLERVLSAPERALYVKDPGGFEATYWAMMDPMWSRPYSDPHLEFLARVSYAELMWSNIELSQHGVDSDRGAVYIRNGPPSRVVSLRNDSRSNTGTIVWEYVHPPTALNRILFDRIPKFHTLSFADDTAIADGPAATWNNLSQGRIDSIPAQMARFRTASDSVDVYFATLPPIAAIKQASQVAGPVRTDFWLKNDRLALVSHESILSSTPGLRAFTMRVQPGTYVYSAEATGEASLFAARARARIIAGDDGVNLFTLHGFGMSDVLLATKAIDRTASPARWTDIDAAPLLTPMHKNDRLALVWETYGLGSTNGTARYDVVITIQPDRPPRRGARSGAAVPPPSNNIAARIVGGLAGALGVKRDVIDDRVEFQFARELPQQSAVVDNIEVSVGDTPPGVYRVTVTVTDRANGASTFGVRRITIIAT